MPLNMTLPNTFDDSHYRPWWSLVYLLFVLLPLLFWGDAPASAWLASVLATALFMPLHLRFYRGRDRAQVWLWLPVALLGYGLIPFNPGGNTFLIYAFAMAGWALPPRRAVGLALGLWLLMALEFWWVLPIPSLAFGYTAVVALIGGMVLSGVIFGRARLLRDAELRLSQQEIARLASLAERERIGRDLHDLLGHTLSVIALKSELAGKLLARDPAAAAIQIGEVEAVARQTLAQVREAVVGIRASGLQAELAAARLALLSADVHLDQRLQPMALSPPAEAALALALREAVTNILRHAAARRVEVELLREPDGVLLRISDDGRGGIEREGTGLTGMRERLAALGGELEVDAATGSGSRLQLRLPLSSLQVLP